MTIITIISFLCQGPGRRERGAPRKWFKHKLKRQLPLAGIGHNAGRRTRQTDRDTWRSMTRKTASTFDDKRRRVDRY